MGSPVKIIYRGAKFAVVLKPAGVAVQPGKGIQKTILDLVEEKLGYRPLLVHRLDRDTEGLLVLARDREAASEFSRILKSDQVQKSYLAVCSGAFGRPEGAIDSDVEVKGVKKSAHTSYRVLRKLGKFSLLEISLGTGRMHQIRLHMSQSGRPIVGDDQHGDFALNRSLKQTHAVKNLMLCAWRLRFPEERRTVTVTAEIPAHFSAFLSIYNATDAIPGSGHASVRFSSDAGPVRNRVS
ncbi:MAG TPA: RNA pseudouridine synthase [Spirochaetia bacterium]|nr:RNA pseudouridine synthase [Spirochaetia bacterium]